MGPCRIPRRLVGICRELRGSGGAGASYCHHPRESRRRGPRRQLGRHHSLFNTYATILRQHHKKGFKRRYKKMHAEHAGGNGINSLPGRVIGCSFTVLNTLGIGCWEKVYDNALAHELRGLAVVRQCGVKCTTMM